MLQAGPTHFALSDTAILNHTLGRIRQDQARSSGLPETARRERHLAAAAAHKLAVSLPQDPNVGMLLRT